MYVSSIGSLTPAGEVVVTIDDLSRHGFRWEQLLIALPFMAVFRRGVKSLKIKLPGGKQLNLSGETLEFLVKLDSRERQQLLAKAKKAKTPQASLAIIERGVQGRRKPPGHHIATNKNTKSALRGGPWTPRFRRVFDRAGMSLEDAENVVRIPGHRGPHPEEYHREIFRRLTTATNGKSRNAYKSALVAELQAIANEAATNGTKLNRLLTN